MITATYATLTKLTCAFLVQKHGEKRLSDLISEFENSEVELDANGDAWDQTRQFWMPPDRLYDFLCWIVNGKRL